TCKRCGSRGSGQVEHAVHALGYIGEPFGSAALDFRRGPSGVAYSLEFAPDGRPVDRAVADVDAKALPEALVELLVAAVFLDVELADSRAQHGNPVLRPRKADDVADVEIHLHALAADFVDVLPH